jgi:hypothetical protein
MQKIIAGLSTALICSFLAVLTPDAALAEAPVTVCDEVASHMNDPSRVAAPVAWNDLDGYRALGACIQAIDAHPTSARLMALLSRAYDKTEDYEESILWARRSAETNYPLGLFLLALHYSEGNSVSEDPEMSFRYMKKAADFDMPAAVYTVGDNYRTGYGVAKDPQRAMGFFSKAAELGFSNADAALGEMWEKGEFGEVDLAKALAFYRKVAARGGNMAQAIARVEAGLGQTTSPAKPLDAAPSRPEDRFKSPTRPNAGSVWVQVASRASLEEAIAVAYEYKAKFESTRLFRSANGWYPIVIGTVKEGAIKATIAEYAAKGMIPEDSYATKGDSFEAELPLEDRPPAKTAPKVANVVEDEPAPEPAAPASIGASSDAGAADPLSPHTRWIVVGTYSDPARAHDEARALGNLQVMRTAGGRYAVVLASGAPQEMAAALDKVRRHGNLSGEAVMVDGHDFVERHFQIAN